MGINQRNLELIMRYNSRHLFPLVDDKLTTKRLCIDHGIAVPELYRVISTNRAVEQLGSTLAENPECVIKPARGSGGNGILVLEGALGDHFRRASGKLIPLNSVKHHVTNTLSGMYSLAGMPDKAFVEYKVESTPLFKDYAYQGVPDIRIIVFRGLPVAAMLRLPTRSSDGKANLHQGALGVGIEMANGNTTFGVCNNRLLARHPDTHYEITGLTIPEWLKIIKLAIKCADVVKLGYLGVDIVIDANLGPLVLELNARPGLNVQLANLNGLDRLTKLIAKESVIPEDLNQRLDLFQRVFNIELQ